MAQKRLIRRMKNAMIPDEFKDAEFFTYNVTNQTQKLLYNAAQDYVANFERIRTEERNSIGFIAKYGERRLREIRDPVKRGQAKQKHNNFGLGKTHLQVAIAKELIRRGTSVLIVSDVSLMGDLSQARQYDDEGEEFNRLLGTVVKAPVLVWDDIGKAKISEFRLDMYYTIINERYKARRPIIYSSNEDSETLAERIGDAATSRLFGMSKGRIYAVEGPDYRMMGA
jgi:DNA replication protein DnaC